MASCERLLTAASLPEVRDWAELRVDRAASEPAVVEVLHGIGSILLAAELDVHIANLGIEYFF